MLARLIVVALFVGITASFATVFAQSSQPTVQTEELRVAIWHHSDGWFEFGIQHHQPDGEWSEVLLPETRFVNSSLPTEKWFSSSSVFLRIEQRDFYPISRYTKPCAPQLGVACSYGEGEGIRFSPQVPQETGRYQMQVWSRSGSCSLTLRAGHEISNFMSMTVATSTRSPNSLGWYRGARSIEVRPATDEDWGRAPRRPDTDDYWEPPDWNIGFYPNNEGAVHTVLIEAGEGCTEWTLAFFARDP